VARRGLRRQPIPEGHAVAAYASDVLALADALGLDRFAFWGYSDGARVGYQLAATRPDRIAALVASASSTARTTTRTSGARPRAPSARTGSARSSATSGGLALERVRPFLRAVARHR
jgi:pimeloyl-ACP methyl ester carboxylesterase